MLPVTDMFGLLNLLLALYEKVTGDLQDLRYIRFYYLASCRELRGLTNADLQAVNSEAGVNS